MLDAAVFDQLYRQLYGVLIMYFTKWTSDEQAAEDLAQDTLLRVWERRATYEPGGSLNGWVFTIAKRILIDKRRRAKRRIFVDIDDIPLIWPRDEMRAVELWIDLERALSRLTVGQQMALWLVAQGHTKRTGGAMMGLTASGFGTAVHRARLALSG